MNPARAARLSAHSATPNRLSAGRLRLFRITAILILPVFALGCLEGALRAFGYGHPTSFFLEKVINGQAILVENTWFGLRFFPSALARSPAPVVMRAKKPDGAFRIFLFGESAALGDPRPAYGVGRCLEALLRERIPGIEFEVICVAMTAINSHAILPIARECADHRGDLWIIYAGHNEMAGPFGANTVFGRQAPPNWVVRLCLSLLRTRTGQWLDALATKVRSADSSPGNWGGLRMFLEQQLPPTDPRRERVYANFRQNLTDIVQTGLRQRVPIILSSVASNLKDCAPFGSLHEPALETPVLEAWQTLLRSAVMNTERGRWAEAVKPCEETIALSPRFAECQFRLGQCLVGSRNLEAASRSFENARDLDALPFRADSRINRIVEEVAGQHANQGVTYLNANSALARAMKSRSGSAPDSATLPESSELILGDELFLDHVHLNFQGNYQLAVALAEKVLANLPANLRGPQHDAWADPVLCAERLGLTDWNRATILEEILRRIAEPPYSNQLNHAARTERLAAKLKAVRIRCDVPAQASARRTYEDAIRLRGSDYWLHHNYAEFLLAIGDQPGALAEMQTVRALASQHYAAYLQIGRLHFRLREYGAAREALADALRLRPDLADAYLELTQIDFEERKFTDALRQLTLAQRYRPNDAALCLRQGEVLVALNRRDEAFRCLRAAIELRPSFWEARSRLGVELAADGKSDEARGQFEEVVRQRPGHPLGHLNLGLLLAAQRQFDAALEQFEESLRLEPHNEPARRAIQNLMERKAQDLGAEASNPKRRALEP